MIDQSDIGDVSFMQAMSKIQTITNQDRRKMVEQSFRKGEFTAEALMRVALKGEINDDDVMQKLADEEKKIARRDLTADVNARVNFNSEMSSINSVLGEVDTGDITVESILSLAQSMPEILDMAS